MNKFSCFQNIFTLVALIATVIAPSTSFAQSVRSETILPPNTKAWVSIADAEALKAALEGTQFGEMMNDPNVRPFVEDLAKQLRSYLDEQNIRFGITVEDIEAVQTGEICLAGILKERVGDAAPEHAVVLMIDVSESQEKAKELLEKASAELIERNATKEDIEIEGVEASKWSFQQPAGLRQRQFAFHVTVGRWLVASDNELVFRDIIRRLADDNEGTPTLAKTDSFIKITEKCQFSKEKYDSHIRWFIEPFGYIQLSQAIADAQTPGYDSRNDYAEKFEEEGFSAIKGVGGAVSIATGKHEAVHRTFVFAPPVVDGPERYKSAAGMLDFRNTGDSQLAPPSWVPQESAGILTFTWDLSNALSRVGVLVDKIGGTEGTFERTLDQIRDNIDGPQVDIRLLVSSLNERITICSVTETPINEDSERLVFGIEITGDEGFVEEAIRKLVTNDADEIDHNGTIISVVDTASLGDGEGPLIEMGGDEDPFGSDFGSDDEEAEEEMPKAKPLFEKRVFAVHGRYLLIGNNVDQVKSIIDRMEQAPGTAIGRSEDYLRVHTALNELAGEAAPSFRHFGRLDRSLRVNYEMMRTGKMAQSKTLLAQLLNRAHQAEVEAEAAKIEAKDDAIEVTERPQHVDGSSMPPDYEGQVAKYLGPTGLVVHTVDEGWLITGCILKKESETSTTKASSAKTANAKDELSTADNK